MPNKNIIDLVAIIDKVEFNLEGDDYITGQRIEDGWTTLAEIYLRIAKLYIELGYKLDKIANVIGPPGGHSAIEIAKNYNHPFLKFMKGDLIIIRGSELYSFTVAEPAPQGLIGSSGSMSATRSWKRLTVNEIIGRNYVEVEQSQVELLGEVKAAEGKVASEILGYYNKEGYDKTIKEFFN